MIDALHVRTIVVLADCHIHPAKGIDWPTPAFEAFRGTDLFITLGDMGESAGLEALAGIAPVIGVRGRDDEEDARTTATLRLLEIGKVRIGCVFDPIEAGVALQIDPLLWAPDDKLSQLFGGMPDALLWASTHRSSVVRRDGRLMLNPGSTTLPAENASASFGRLTLSGDEIEGEIVTL